MGLPLILRLPRVESNPEPQYVLLHVSQNGNSPLDLKLVGTESSEVFTVSIKHNKTSVLKAKNSKSAQEEWEAVLSAVLLGDTPEVEKEFLEGVEAVAEVEEGALLTITIQKRIEGITQRLGQIVLNVTEDEELDLYEWCSLTIGFKNTLKQEAIAFSSTIKSKEQEIQKLQAALSELTTLKNKNEDALLEKFSLLLNEKKLKIRDQQRLLAASTTDPAKVEEMEIETREASAGPSRPRKRKAAAKAVAENSDSEDGFEKMEVDKPAPAEEWEDDGSDKADERTASETESDSDAPPPPPTKKPPPKKAASPPSRRTRAQTAETEQPEVEKEVSTPPKRELPFAKKPPPKSKAATPPPAGGQEGSETESDDEL